MDTVKGLVAGKLMFDFYSRTDDQLSAGDEKKGSSYFQRVYFTRLCDR